MAKLMPRTKDRKFLGLYMRLLGESTYNKICNIFLIVTILALGVSCIYSWRFAFHSDNAAFSIFAEQIREQRSIVPKDFYYPNGDIWTFTPGLIIAFLTLFLSNGYLAHGLASFFIGLLIMLSVYKTTYLLSKNLNTSKLMASLFGTGISPVISDLLFGQGYGLSFAIYMSAIFFMLRAADSVKNKESSWSIYAIISNLFLSLNFFTNPQRGVLQLLPIFLAMLLFVYTIHGFSNYSLKVFLIYLAITFLIQLVALIFRLKSLSGLNVIYGVAGASFSSPESFSINLSNIFNGMFYTFGLQGPSGTRLFSIMSLLVFTKSLALLYLVVEGIKVLKNFKSFEPKISAFLFLSFVGLSVSTFLLQYTNLNNGIYAFRYLLMPLFTVLMGFLIKLLQSSKFAFLTVAAILAIGSISMGANIRQDTSKLPSDQKLIKTLSKFNTSHLLASYWYSSRLQILSDSKIRISTIKFSETMCIEPYYWVNKHFNLEKDHLVLILDSDEFSQFTQNPSCKVLFPNNPQVIRSGDFFLVESI